MNFTCEQFKARALAAVLDEDKKAYENALALKKKEQEIAFRQLSPKLVLLKKLDDGNFDLCGKIFISRAMGSNDEGRTIYGLIQSYGDTYSSFIFDEISYGRYLMEEEIRGVQLIKTRWSKFWDFRL